jgi:hypothetical protein
MDSGTAGKRGAEYILDWRRVAVFAAVVTAVAGAAAYFAIFRPAGGPAGSGGGTATPQLTSENVAGVVAGLGGGLLVASGEGKPEIELNVTDVGLFTITVENGIVSSRPGAATDPDMRITTTSTYMDVLMRTDRLDEEVANQYKAGHITIELLKDVGSLTAKGYSAVYGRLARYL